MSWLFPALLGIFSIIFALLIGLIFVHPELVIGLRQWVLLTQWRAMGDIRSHGLRRIGVERGEISSRVLGVFKELHRFSQYSGDDTDRMMSQITPLRNLVESDSKSERRGALLEVLKINARLAEHMEDDERLLAIDDKPYRDVVVKILCVLYPNLSSGEDIGNFRRALVESPPSYNQLFELFVASSMCLRAHVGDGEKF